MAYESIHIPAEPPGFMPAEKPDMSIAGCKGGKGKPMGGTKPKPKPKGGSKGK